MPHEPFKMQGAPLDWNATTTACAPVTMEDLDRVAELINACPDPDEVRAQVAAFVAECDGRKLVIVEVDSIIHMVITRDQDGTRYVVRQRDPMSTPFPNLINHEPTHFLRIGEDTAPLP